MNKPIPTRKDDVLSKLAYVAHRRGELMNELFSAKKEDRDPEHLVHAASEVLATSRECFDYLAQDIALLHILPHTSQTKIKNDYADGKLRAYFPFHPSQLTKPSALFNELSNTSPQLFTALCNLADDIEKNAPIPKSLFEYGQFIELKDMVNEKKHDKLIGYVSEEAQEHLIESEGRTMIVPKKGQVGWSSFQVQPGSTVKQVAEYRFEFNDREVGKFCLFAHKATELVITELYGRHFG